MCNQVPRVLIGVTGRAAQWSIEHVSEEAKALALLHQMVIGAEWRSLAAEMDIEMLKLYEIEGGVRSPPGNSSW